MSRLLLLSLFPLLLTAQQIRVGGGDPKTEPRASSDASSQPPQTQATKPEDLCALEGQVVNAQSGEPVRKANIILTRIDTGPSSSLPPSYSTTSDPGGNFAMKDIEPGQYHLMANRNGYVNMLYGAKGPGRPGTTLSLARQQHMTQLLLKLAPHGVITGRIVDEDGDPIANARVMIESYRYTRGRKQLSPGGQGSTNDLGEYRIFGVAPGKYYLSVTPNSSVLAYSVDRSATAAPSEDYVANYYPGTLDPSAATELEVTAGAQLRGIDMRLAKARTVHIKGHVTHSVSGRPYIQLFIRPRTSGFIGAFRPLRVDPAGNFDIPGIAPGAYNLTATIMEGNVNYQARVPVDVGTTDVEGLNVVIGAGLTIRGRIRAENSDAAPVDLSTVRITLQSREPAGIFFGQGKPDDEGKFEISNIPVDRFNFFIYGLPDGAYVKSIRTERADLLAFGLDLTGGAAPDAVEIVISPKAAVVTGTVQNPNTGNPFPGATVVLVPQEPERRDQSGYFKTVTSDQNGTFQFKSASPGEYKAYAWEDLEPEAYMDPDVLKPVADKGVTVSLQEGDQKSLTLQLIPATSPGSAN